MTANYVTWELPAEVWARIFAESCGAILSGGAQDMERACKKQTWFFSLGLVCKTFKRVLQIHPHLYKFIAIKKNHKDYQLSALLQWVARHHRHLQHVIATCKGPTPELVLAVLYAHPDNLNRVGLMKTSPQCISLLSGFHSLTDCTLQSPHKRRMDLQGFSTLASLTKLALFDCKAYGIDSARYLTALQLHHAQVLCCEGCSITQSLIEMDLYHSRLECEAPLGICACSSLQACRLVNSRVTCWPPGNLVFGEDQVWISEELSALTALTCLSLTLEGNQHKQVAEMHITPHQGSSNSLLARVQVTNMVFRPSVGLGDLINLTSVCVCPDGLYQKLELTVEWGILGCFRWERTSGEAEFSNWLQPIQMY